MFGCKLFLVLYSLLGQNWLLPIWNIGHEWVQSGACAPSMKGPGMFSSLFLLVFSTPKETDSVLNIFIVSLMYLPGTIFLLTLKMGILRTLWYFAHKYLVSLLLLYKVLQICVQKELLKRTQKQHLTDSCLKTAEEWINYKIIDDKPELSASFVAFINCRSRLSWLKIPFFLIYSLYTL